MEGRGSDPFAFRGRFGKGVENGDCSFHWSNQENVSSSKHYE
jgi:hypothetical protein